jgi:hypothetical protein
MTNDFVETELVASLVRRKGHNTGMTITAPELSTIRQGFVRAGTMVIIHTVASLVQAGR